MSKINQLREALEQELGQQGSNPLTRLSWLASRAEEYVGRWVGFSELPHTSFPSLISNDFFSLIQVTAEIIASEFEKIQTDDHIMELWRSFEIELGRIAGMDRKSDTSQFVLKIEQFRIELLKRTRKHHH